MRVKLVHPTRQHWPELDVGFRRSRKLHRNYMVPMKSEEVFQRFLGHCNGPRSSNFLVVLRDSGGLVGGINVENIARGLFQSATLGYYALMPHAGRGLMREGLIQALDHVFRELKLHRLEANIQPTNLRSINLVKGLGFSLEGYSPRFLKICGRWRDHERWAIHADTWRKKRKILCT